VASFRVSDHLNLVHHSHIVVLVQITHLNLVTIEGGWEGGGEGGREGER